MAGRLLRKAASLGRFLAASRPPPSHQGLVGRGTAGMISLSELSIFSWSLSESSLELSIKKPNTYKCIKFPISLLCGLLWLVSFEGPCQGQTRLNARPVCRTSPLSRAGYPTRKYDPYDLSSFVEVCHHLELWFFRQPSPHMDSTSASRTLNERYL